MGERRRAAAMKKRKKKRERKEGGQGNAFSAFFPQAAQCPLRCGGPRARAFSKLTQRGRRHTMQHRGRKRQRERKEGEENRRGRPFLALSNSAYHSEGRHSIELVGELVGPFGDTWDCHGQRAAGESGRNGGGGV